VTTLTGSECAEKMRTTYEHHGAHSAYSTSSSNKARSQVWC